MSSFTRKGGYLKKIIRRNRRDDNDWLEIFRWVRARIVPYLVGFNWKFTKDFGAALLESISVHLLKWAFTSCSTNCEAFHLFHTRHSNFHLFQLRFSFSHRSRIWNGACWWLVAVTCENHHIKICVSILIEGLKNRRIEEQKNHQRRFIQGPGEESSTIGTFHWTLLQSWNMGFKSTPDCDADTEWRCRVRSAPPE